MKLTSAVQEALIAIICYDSEHAVEVIDLVPHTLYDPYFSEIAEAAGLYVSRFKEVPKDHTLDIIESLSGKYPDKEEFYVQIYKSLQITKDSINSSYIIEQATKFVRYQTLKKALGSSIRALQKEDDAGLSEAEALLKNALETNFKASDLGVDLCDSERSLSFLNAVEASSFPTGLEALDSVGLGPARGRLHLFIGPAGTGKSWWLAHLAKHSHIARQRVLYVTLELSEEEVCQRCFQGLYSISKRDESLSISRIEVDSSNKFVSIRTDVRLNRPSLEDENIKDVLLEKISKMRSRPAFKIKAFPTGSLSVRDLENYLDILEAKEGFIPDLLIIDYADLMRLDTKNYRLDVGQLYKNLRGLANRRNIALATASQTNRASLKEKWITGDNVAEDWSKIAIADTVISFNQTGVEHQLGLARLFVIKGRTDKDKFAILISQVYAAGQFALDSTSYVPTYWDDLKSTVVESVTGEGI